MRAYSLVLVTAAGFVFATASVGAVKTTAPDKAILIDVNITDRGMRAAMFTKSTDDGVTTYVAAVSAKRGQIAYFVIRNHGKKPHNFVLLGRKTKSIQPGAAARLRFTLLGRGTFVFQSTLDKGKTNFRGRLIVV